jgi:hypothetical protein
MAHIIPNEQHPNVSFNPTALSNFREKQFTGSPNKVQLALEVRSPQNLARKKQRNVVRSS